MEYPDLVELSDSDYERASESEHERTSDSNNKRKRATVAPHNAFQIDDDGPAGNEVVDLELATGNKGKDKLSEYKVNWDEKIKKIKAALKDFSLPEFGSLSSRMHKPIASKTEFSAMSSEPSKPIMTSTDFGAMSTKPFNPYATPTDFGSIFTEPFNPLASSSAGSYLDNLYGGSFNYGLHDFGTPSPFVGHTTFKDPFSSMDFSVGSSIPFQGTSMDSSVGPKIPLDGMDWSTPYDPSFFNFESLQPSYTQTELSSASHAKLKQPCYTRDVNVDDKELLRRYKSFKQFDTVRDYSDHYFDPASSVIIQPPRNWAKAIQREWKMLQKDLPDTIFVRVYEEKMDLLRAVIVGAAGTPYHDGLFFFDIMFPREYPNIPPLVYYHSRGLRLNPNLYNDGKVCLSLLNTWPGEKEEIWTPKKSTILQVLLSIQALVLNAKPYFNEPGYSSMEGSLEGDKRSRAYNESTYILSCRSMLYILKRPPKHFEEYVAGHFLDRAYAILVACKAYMEGAQVGSLVEGGVQDVDEGDKSCSDHFRGQVSTVTENLVSAFGKNGSQNCEQFLPKKDYKRTRPNPYSAAYSWQ